MDDVTEDERKAHLDLVTRVGREPARLFVVYTYNSSYIAAVG